MPARRLPWRPSRGCCPGPSPARPWRRPTTSWPPSRPRFLGQVGRGPGAPGRELSCRAAHGRRDVPCSLQRHGISRAIADPSTWTVTATAYGPSGQRDMAHPVRIGRVRNLGQPDSPPLPRFEPAGVGRRHRAPDAANSASEDWRMRPAGRRRCCCPCRRTAATARKATRSRALKTDIAGAKGSRRCLVETTAGGWQESGKVAAPLADWKTARLGPQPARRG